MNHHETQSHADRGADPGNVKDGGIVVLVGGKDHRESHNLRDDVGKKILERAVLAAAKHSYGNQRLENGVRDPESIVQNPDFLAHRNYSLSLFARGTKLAPESASARILSYCSG